MWRTTLVKVGSQEKPKYEARDWPCTCERCPDAQRERYGCGWSDATRGKGLAVHADNKDELLDTCPQWYARQPLVASVYDLLGDYRDGRLGDVRDLPADLLTYLRAASAELEVWTRIQQGRVMDGD